MFGANIHKHEAWCLPQAEGQNYANNFFLEKSQESGEETHWLTVLKEAEGPEKEKA